LEDSVFSIVPDRASFHMVYIFTGTWAELEQKFHPYFFTGTNEKKLVDLMSPR